MANPAVAKNSWIPPKGGEPGILVLTLTWTTYAQGTDVIDVSGIVNSIPNFDPAKVVAVNGVSAAGHSVVWTPAASPSLTNVGVVKLFGGTTQATAGALSTTARVVILVGTPQIF